MIDPDRSGDCASLSATRRRGSVVRPTVWTALRASLERAIAAEPVDPEEVETALGAAYRGVLQVDPGIIERIRRAIAELIENVLSRLFSFRAPARWSPGPCSSGWGSWRLAGPPPAARPRDRHGSGPAAGRRTARVDWIARAEGAFRAGDLHGAVHAFYRGLLTALSGRGLLIDAPGLTAGECRSTVRSPASRTVRGGRRGDRGVRAGRVRRCRARGRRRGHACVEGGRAREVRMSRRVGGRVARDRRAPARPLVLVPRAESVESTLALRRFLAESGTRSRREARRRSRAGPTSCSRPPHTG